MAKRNKREQSFLGMFYAPICWCDLEPILERWKEILNEANTPQMYKDWYYLEFDFKKKNKKKKRYKREVYKDLARAVAYGWFKERNLTEICRNLAECTNLADGPRTKNKEEAIRHGINGQMKFFKKERIETQNDPSLIITSKQRRKSA